MRWLKFLVPLLLLAAPAAADEYIYAPEKCEFRLTLPGEPYKTMRCNPDDPEDCQEVTTYTKVFDLHATVNFKVTCNPVKENMYERYSGEVMQATLSAMAEAQQLEDHHTGFNQTENIKQAVIMGTGRTGNSDKMYIGQLWIGHESVMMIEGELTGAPLEEAEAMLISVLRSLRHRSEEASPGNGAAEEAAEAPPEKAPEETVEEKAPEKPAAAAPVQEKSEPVAPAPEKAAEEPPPAKPPPPKVTRMPRKLND